MADAVTYAEINFIKDSKRRRRPPAGSSGSENKERWWKTTVLIALCLCVATVTVVIAVKLLGNPSKCCPESWVQYSGSCYYFSVNKTTWNASEVDCISQGAHLVVVKDEEELRFLYLQCRIFVSFWLGLKRNPLQDWVWIDERPYTLTRMNSRDLTKNGDCAFLENTSVRSYDCSKEKHWICKKETELL
ncbi:C-type lectin domain family 2 member B-like [Polypterus senegalus]|uniref:C-type lectin domain family 2 member B-like n=1 Tax=Polypterus senegalus TaxID=55291 RepID=UPI001965E0A8|nr:C-type lectin domain family 2 member B-like [Polypterus senegalus]